MTMNGGWQKAVFWIVGLVLGIFIGVQGWAINKVLDLDKDLATIKANRFTDEEGAVLEREIQRKADREDMPSRDYLEERFKRLEEKLDRLEAAIR